MSHPLSRPVIDLAGQRFGRLVAIRWNAGDIAKAWLCQCECGAEVVVRGAFLRSGKTKSCGCYKRERMKAGLGRKHGMEGSRTYTSWAAMLGRCRNPNDPSYGHYGARGITVCERWEHFSNFLTDMGERPSGTTIDRIDSTGGYGPGNCRWATAKEQQNNISSNRRVCYEGSTYTLRQLSDLTGVSYELLRTRIGRGWDVVRAVTTTPQQKRRNA